MNENKQNTTLIKTFQEFAQTTDYSLLNTLNCNPQATKDGIDYLPRQVFSGHYVPVASTPINEPIYITHSKTFFKELGLDDNLAQSSDFMSMFSGDMSSVPEPMNKLGWATGYALSIYGREYYDQCPFKTGNGYGDGRAVSVFEGVLNGKRWEMQLKGGGKTPYCRGADGRAVLRSSVREFLAQEQMYGLGIPTSRSLSLYTSQTEFVQRPWYSEGSYSQDPDMLVSESVAISTRVAPSFIRVGQIELFARRTRKKEHPKAREELEKIVLHLIDREYSEVIDTNLSLPQKILLLAKEFRSRLISLVTNWIRVGFCQGNFNGDNCAAGGYTLDFGPFGFCDLFDPAYQSWTGGGRHFAFLNQPAAAERNFLMFCLSLQELLLDENDLEKLTKIRNEFSNEMQIETQTMWANKLGLSTFDSELFDELQALMLETSVDYTIFFRELSNISDNFDSLQKSFYRDLSDEVELQKRWSKWFINWKSLIKKECTASNKSTALLSEEMKLINPKFILREWILVPAYQKAKEGDYSLIKELQEVMINPYSEQSNEISDKYYKLKPLQFFEVGGISHLSCSS